MSTPDSSSWTIDDLRAFIHRFLNDLGSPEPYDDLSRALQILTLYSVAVRLGVVEATEYPDNDTLTIDETRRRLLELIQRMGPRHDEKPARVPISANADGLPTQVEQSDGRDAAAKKQMRRVSPQQTITYIGERQYCVGAAAPISVTEAEDCVLQAFLEKATMDTPTLATESGMEEPAKVLRGLRDKYGRIFAPAILTPGVKGGGGYHVRIKRI